MSSNQPANAPVIRVNVYHLLLSGVLAATLGTAYWLITPDTGDRIAAVAKTFNHLQLDGNYLEAEALFLQQVEGQDRIDPLWIGLIRQVENGYLKLSLMLKVLRHSPQRVATYEEISKLIEIAPEAFHQEVKPRYLSDLASIEGVNAELLGFYNLQPEQ